MTFVVAVTVFNFQRRRFEFEDVLVEDVHMIDADAIGVM